LRFLTWKKKVRGLRERGDFHELVFRTEDDLGEGEARKRRVRVASRLWTRNQQGETASSWCTVDRPQRRARRGRKFQSKVHRPATVPKPDNSNTLRVAVATERMKSESPFGKGARQSDLRLKT